jgi:N-formylglutamate amidohydrolase
MIPIVLHIPHASREVPDTDRVEIVLCDTDLERELLLMTDAWTDELLKFSDDYDVTRVIAPVSRLVCDVERFRDDDEEDMSQVGMGAVYTSTSNGRSLREPTAETRIRILETYYDPHHALLTKAVDEALEKAG